MRTNSIHFRPSPTEMFFSLCRVRTIMSYEYSLLLFTLLFLFFLSSKDCDRKMHISIS